LITAKRDLNEKDYPSANNRAYYAIFHAMRAVLATYELDFRRHSAVISNFMRLYLKTNKTNRNYGELITNASIIRNKSDYSDFYVCSKEDTIALVNGAEDFINDIQKYLENILILVYRVTRRPKTNQSRIQDSLFSRCFGFAYLL